MRISNKFAMRSDLAELHSAQEMIEEALQIAAYTENDVFRIKLAIEEALVNAVRHGNRMDPDKWVHIAYSVGADRFSIRIADEGDGFNHDDSPDPTYEHVFTRPTGSGLLLMRGFMTSVQFHGKGNVVTMTKVREA